MSYNRIKLMRVCISQKFCLHLALMQECFSAHACGVSVIYKYLLCFFPSFSVDLIMNFRHTMVHQMVVLPGSALTVRIETSAVQTVVCKFLLIYFTISI